MDYSKVDWSRCKLPACWESSKVEAGALGGIRVLLGKTLVAYWVGQRLGWSFGAAEAPHPCGLSRREAEWALKAADAVDAFLVEEQKRVELESQPWISPDELLRTLMDNKGKGIFVASEEHNGITFVFDATGLHHSFGGTCLDTNLAWFMVKNGRYRIIPQSQPDTPRVDPGDGWRLLKRGETILSGDEYYAAKGPNVRDWEPTLDAGGFVSNGIYRRRVAHADTPRVEKKWKESLVVTGEHKFIALRSAVSPATLEVSNTIQNPVTSCSSDFPGPGQRVRLTLEVEE